MFPLSIITFDDLSDNSDCSPCKLKEEEMLFQQHKVLNSVEGDQAYDLVRFKVENMKFNYGVKTVTQKNSHK